MALSLPPIRFGGTMLNLDPVSITILVVLAVVVGGVAGAYFIIDAIRSNKK